MILKSRLLIITQGLSLLTLCLSFASCNEHVFEQIDKCGTPLETSGAKVEPSKSADILIVVDNSKSMLDEQQKLVKNFYVEDDPSNPENNCPIDVNNVQEKYKNPSESLARELGEKCGFIQILAAYENDFRVGVITTDVGMCDNREMNATEGWGRNRQRGCLQAPEGGFDGRKYLKKGDVDIAKKFKEILEREVGIYGMPDERGLDAAKFFLDADTGPNSEQCGKDRDNFIRPEAALIVIYLTDEDDCSHPSSALFTDEFKSDTCKNQLDQGQKNGQECYSAEGHAALTPVDSYIKHLKNAKGEDRSASVRVAVIAGGLPEDGGVYAGSCFPAALNEKDIPNGMCYSSQGRSNFFQEPSYPCHPDKLAEIGEERCCNADASTRYFQLADGFGSQAFKDSICLNNFRQTMVGIARFSSNIEEMDMDKEPSQSEQIIVRNTIDNKTENLERIPDDASPAGKNGWQYEKPKTIRFYGNAIPGPGDNVEVLAAGEPINKDCE